jgi:uncharacterized membrane protein YphA (DoxX/SURF4 family)
MTMVVRSLSYVLGAIFLIAGISKLFILDAFAVTVATTMLIPLAYALILAIGVIAAEVLGAIALFARFKIRLVAMMFCVLVALFVWVLSSAVIQGREITCNCFGNIGIGLTNTQELLLDIVLFNAFAFLAYYSPGKGRVPGKGQGRRGLSWKMIIAAVLVLLEVSLMMPVLNGGKTSTHLRAEAAVGFAERVHPQFALRHPGNRAILLMKYADLGCALCFDDFLAFADSAGSQLGKNSHRVLVVFDEDQFIRNDSSNHLRRWISANGITLPVVVAPDSILSNAGVVKSMVIIIDRKNDVVFTERFPMGTVKRLIALQLLRPDGIPDITLSQ